MTSDITYDDAVLAHYGVEGMRWGVRKQPYTETLTGRPLTRKQLIANAVIKKNQGPNRRKDERSKKTIALGKANTALTLTALGTIVAGALSPEPISKGILLTTGILAAVGSVTISQLEGRSAGDDALNLYGKK